MRREGREVWLKPEEYVLWVMHNQPDRIATPEERSAPPADPTVEAKQFRAGASQGVLCRTSPLQGQLLRKARS